MFRYTFLFAILSFTSGQPCDEKTSVDLTGGQTFSDGTIVYDGVTYPKDYVFLRNVSGEFRTFGCLCELKKCFRKCCPLGSVMKISERGCVESKKDDILLNKGLDTYFLNAFKKTSSLEQSGLSLVIGKPDYVYLEDDGKWYVQQDGNLYIELPMSIPPWTVRGPDKYCIDTFVYEDEEGNTKTQLDALVCFAEPSFDPTSYIISSTCMLISCVFILATVAVYAWLPELRNLHGRVLMAYLLSLFVGFLFLATMQILLIINNVTAECCLVLTFIIYFFLLSAFFWLNVMSFDIWWTFSGKRGLSLEKLSTRARFCAYAFYAFGVPTALTIIMAGLEFSGLPAHPLLPNIKHQGCFLFGKSKLLYFYGPIVALCVANMLFFILTALKIAQIRKQTSVLKSKESTMHDQHRNDQQRLLLYVKLFAVMGINWLLEVISALYPDADYLWRYTDAYNVLIGLITFIIFVCKRKIFRLMKKRIEESIHRRKSEVGNMREFSQRDRTDWRSCHNQRASLDTIRSSLCVDTDSVKTKTTQC
ncbi:G-protein coupled receptor Mth2-like isoform X2 [Pectinophora gossypiella]|uniref:G-protein coupled receptor Mth2-like isoform X2 n=1 Tax=Pectinophora gossypiella TaxID=13191 RepID=UPI00214E3584|nr:G-protein coupled receptor Mth2-like isoform X2 [Pectinophora gossypiella]